MTGRPLIDITDRVYGRLTVLYRFSKGQNTKWMCACTCGRRKPFLGGNLRSGRTTSCGCYCGEIIATRNTVHGMHGTGSYKSWQRMLSRCYYRKDIGFADYGGRGIQVCDKWHTFEGFYADMGDRPPGMTLEREDNDGNYEYANCHWATPKEQANNRRKR